MTATGSTIDREQPPEPPKPMSARSITFAISTAIVVLIVVLVFPFGIYPLPDDASAFGDSFGFANAVVSAFAFAALVMTMFYQREELRLQRFELQMQRLEMERLTKANNEAAQAQKDSYRTLLHSARLTALESLRRNQDSKRNPHPKPYEAVDDKVNMFCIDYEIASTVRQIGLVGLSEGGQSSEKFLLSFTTLATKVMNIILALEHAQKEKGIAGINAALDRWTSFLGDGDSVVANEIAEARRKINELLQVDYNFDYGDAEKRTDWRLRKSEAAELIQSLVAMTLTRYSVSFVDLFMDAERALDGNEGEPQ